MKTLIVEDDLSTSLLLQEILKDYGPCDAATNGVEALERFELALKEGEPYHLICMDIMMPEMDGQEALKMIRDQEELYGILPSKGAKIIMITALDDLKNVFKAYYNLADSYLVKPINKEKLLIELRKLGLTP